MLLGSPKKDLKPDPKPTASPKTLASWTHIAHRIVSTAIAELACLAQGPLLAQN
jgi:hypothetical protein